MDIIQMAVYLAALRCWVCTANQQSAPAPSGFHTHSFSLTHVFLQSRYALRDKSAIVIVIVIASHDPSVLLEIVVAHLLVAVVALQTLQAAVCEFLARIVVCAGSFAGKERGRLGGGRGWGTGGSRIRLGIAHWENFWMDSEGGLASSGEEDIVMMIYGGDVDMNDVWWWW